MIGFCIHKLGKYEQREETKGEHSVRFLFFTNRHVSEQMEVEHPFWQQKDVVDTVIWNILPLSIVASCNDQATKIKICPVDSDGRTIVMIERIGDTGSPPMRPIMIQVGQVINFDLVGKLRHDYYGIYYNTLVLKPLFRRLLRLSQCSKGLYEKVMGHPLIKEVCLYFHQNPFVTAYYNALYEERDPLLYINQVVQNGQKLGDEFMAIINYRPPPIQLKPQSRKKRVAPVKRESAQRKPKKSRDPVKGKK